MVEENESEKGVHDNGMHEIKNGLFVRRRINSFIAMK